MRAPARADRPLSPLAVGLLILCLLTGQTAAAVHTGLPAAGNTQHHHADQGPIEHHLKAPTDHHDHHASGGVECPCLLCAGSALANTGETALPAARKAPVPTTRARGAPHSTSLHLLPLPRAPPLTV